MQSTHDTLADRVTTVLVACELLLEDAYGSLSPQQRRILTDVVKAGREIRDLVRDDAAFQPLD